MTATDASQRNRRGVRSIAVRSVIALLALVAVVAGGAFAQRKAIENLGEPAVVVSLSGWLAPGNARKQTNATQQDRHTR